MQDLMHGDYNTFVKNKNYPGAYTALDDINTLGTVPENAEFDFVNSAGGMTGKQIDTILGEEKYIPELNEMPAKFGITTISDRWDLHPFSIYDNQLTPKVKRAYGKHIFPKLNKISNFVFHRILFCKIANFCILQHITIMQ